MWYCSAGGATQKVSCITAIEYGVYGLQRRFCYKQGYHAHGSSGADVASLKAPPLGGRAAATPQLPGQQLARSILYGLCQDLLQHRQGPVLARAVPGKPCCLHSQTFAWPYTCEETSELAAYMCRGPQRFPLQTIHGSKA